MKLQRVLWALLLAGASTFSGAVGRLTAGPPGPTDAEVQKIASAVPQQATAVPRHPRKLLVFTLAKGYVHASIPYGAKALELTGQKTGAFQTTISDDIALFDPATLRQFDGVCLMSALGELFLPTDLDQLPPAEQTAVRQRDARLKQGLVDYVKGGKGLIGIHGASYAFYQWPEFGEMLGGFFDSHPWHANERIAVKIDEPAHPVVAAFAGKDFQIVDEGYQFKDPYSRAKVRVLLSLDPTRTSMNKQNLRADHDFGLSWVKRYGQGRVFYCALGHNPEEYWNPPLLRHFLDGIQFALGDLPANADPH